MNYYEILGLIPNAEPTVIKAAYRALVSIYHPDQNNNQSSTDKIKNINAAYAILSDSIKKAEYDSKIEIDKNNASSSSFSTSPPFYTDPLEKDWELACDFYPNLKEQHSNLVKISWSLAFAFKLLLLESKNFNKSLSVSQSLKLNYLSKYFGDDINVINYAKLLIINREIDAALHLNSIVKVMGNSITKYEAERKINRKYPKLKYTLIYNSLKDQQGKNYFTAERLVNFHSGKVIKRIFSSKINVQVNGKKYEFQDVEEFGKFVLKNLPPTYNL